MYLNKEEVPLFDYQLHKLKTHVYKKKLHSIICQ